jgi:hypothetical protein
VTATGAVTMLMFSLIQLFQNQFGYDRDGFRVFVLSPASRRDILLGKNLSIAPLAISLGTIVLVILQIVAPLQLTHFVAVLVQLIVAFLVVCMVGNVMSVFAPAAVAVGTLRSIRPNTTTTLLQLAFALLLPAVLAPLFVPIGVELAMRSLGWGSGVPICLILSVIELGLATFIYRRVLTAQGRMLQNRQLRILETVTARSE